MLLLISPAKSLNYSPQNIVKDKTVPHFLDSANELAEILVQFSQAELQKLMGISSALAQKNVERYQLWKFSGKEDMKQAIFAFNGDVYEGIDALKLSQKALSFLQSNLRILSGMYGVLKPFDMILPHRLEMGTPLRTSKGKSMYDFWGNSITEILKQEIGMQHHSCVINLASQEYFKVLKIKDISVPIITPVFKDYKNGSLKVISFYAKKARGQMVRYIAETGVSKPQDLIGFDYDGYCYDANLSTELQYVFTR